MAAWRFSFLFGVAVSAATAAAWSENGGRLRVAVDSVTDSSATLRVCLFQSPEGFPGDARRAFRCNSITPVASSSTIVFDGVPFGPMAVSVYQDMNGNGILDKNFIGIPLEPSGVSGPGYRPNGKPRFEKAMFPFQSDGDEVRIGLRGTIERASP